MEQITSLTVIDTAIYKVRISIFSTTRRFNEDVKRYICGDIFTQNQNHVIILFGKNRKVFVQFHQYRVSLNVTGTLSLYWNSG